MLEHVIELIEINIHDWTRRPGHLAARLMPTSVTVRAALPAVREGGLLRSGRGRMPVMSQRSEGIMEELLWRHWRSERPASALLHKDIEDMDRGELPAFSPGVWTRLGPEHPHPNPAGCLWASVNGGCSTEPCQPPHSPQQLLAAHWPRAAHINATLISKGADQPIMHSSVKIQRLKGILMLHHTLQNDLNVQYK